MAVKKQNWGWMRHVLTTISVCFFVLGCVIMGYMTWVLATSSLTMNRFMSGTEVFTYTVIGQAMFLFLNGLIGSVGSHTKTTWLVHLFIGASVMFILMEIGGIIAVNIIDIDMEDIVERGWLELNQQTRNLIQSNLECCGLKGPQDFVASSSPIDESCYEPIDTEESSSLLVPENVIKAINPHFRLKKAGCGSQLYQWLEENKIGWVTILAAIGAFEFMATAIAIFILRRLKTNSRPRTLSRRRLRQHEVEIANDPLPSELP